MSSRPRGADLDAPADRAARGARPAARRAATVLLAATLVCLAACGAGATTPAPPKYTAVPIGPTAWPSGTVGHYGLRIDPSLLGRLPASVAALPIVEDAVSESGAMDDADLAADFDGYVAASIGVVTDPDWLYVAIGRLKPDKQNNADFYTAWVEQYATAACSQANGVASSGQQTIDDKTVDVSTCNGGPVVYTLVFGDGLLLSMFGLGPRDLGRKLIGSLN